MSACLTLGCAAPDGFVPIFDGESLTGWEGNFDTFRVDNDAIVGGSLNDEILLNEYLCTKDEYENFELRLQGKSSRPLANGGIQFRSQRVPGSTDVVGYQADIGFVGDPAENYWGALYDHRQQVELLVLGGQQGLSEVFRPGDWNDYVIRAEGSRIRVSINGFQTADYVDESLELSLSGIFGLQIHRGEAAEMSYRRIEVKRLD